MRDGLLARILGAGAAAVVVAALAVGASADPARAQRAGRGVCQDDIRRFCTNLEPRRTVTRSCLEDHAADLSSSCRALLQERNDHIHTREPRSCGKGSGAPGCPANRLSND